MLAGGVVEGVRGSWMALRIMGRPSLSKATPAPPTPDPGVASAAPKGPEAMAGVTGSCIFLRVMGLPSLSNASLELGEEEEGLALEGPAPVPVLPSSSCGVCCSAAPNRRPPADACGFGPLSIGVCCSCPALPKLLVGCSSEKVGASGAAAGVGAAPAEVGVAEDEARRPGAAGVAPPAVAAALVRDVAQLTGLLLSFLAALRWLLLVLEEGVAAAGVAAAEARPLAELGPLGVEPAEEPLADPLDPAPLAIAATLSKASANAFAAAEAAAAAAALGWLPLLLLAPAAPAAVPGLLGRVWRARAGRVGRVPPEVVPALSPADPGPEPGVVRPTLEATLAAGLATDPAGMLFPPRAAAAAGLAPAADAAWVDAPGLLPCREAVDGAARPGAAGDARPATACSAASGDGAEAAP